MTSDNGQITSDERREEFARNEYLEQLLGPLNEDLRAAEVRVLKDYLGRRPESPPIFILGAPRCGSTLFMQWLAATGAFAYPTNLLSRFWGAPIIGARVQKLLTDPTYDFRDELYDLKCDASYHSDHGKTRGALAPNEFWYFWRRFLPGSEDHFTEYLQDNVDVSTLRAEIVGLTDVLGASLAAKGMIFNENVPFMAKLFPEAIFVWLRRIPEYNIQSLLMARERQFGDMSQWYSFRIHEYANLKDKPPVESVSGQIAAIHRSIDKGVSELSPDRLLTVDYEMFCQNPEFVYDELKERLRAQGAEIPFYRGPRHFDVRNQWRLTWVTRERVRSCFDQFET